MHRRITRESVHVYRLVEHFPESRQHYRAIVICSNTRAGLTDHGAV